MSRSEQIPPTRMHLFNVYDNAAKARLLAHEDMLSKFELGTLTLEDALAYCRANVLATRSYHSWQAFKG